MKIGFQIYSGPGWLAGQTTLASTLAALHSLAGDAPEMALVVWPGMGPQDHSALGHLVEEVITVTDGPRRKSPPAGVRQHVKRWLDGNAHPPRPGSHAAEFVRQHHVDCLFATPLARRPAMELPIVLWLPDLQHVHLPEFFSREERSQRDALYRQELAVAAAVLVTAETVRQDIAQFAPTEVSKTRVLEIVVAVPPTLYSEDPAPLAHAYHLPERFFWMPNQFWKHKNHALVLAALRLLQARSVYPRVVCAGNLSDHRTPQHVGELLRQASLWNLREQFILLGMVPNAEVLRLMRQAVCLLNPSRFEGFGFSVAESKTVGKRALLSDIPAHREQDPPGAMYFDPNDADDLADKMEMIWKAAAPGPDLGLEAAARAAFPGRQQAFGRAFLSLAQAAGQQPALQPAAGRQP